MTPVQVLVVDDEGELVSALAERLTLRGFCARGVTSGAAALACLGEQRFDVVLVDVKMPGLGGFDLVRAIKARWPAQPVVLLTGYTSVEDVAAGDALRVAAYLLKPVDIDELSGALRAAAAAHEVEP
jgi:DNA-binding response OmpR family regulator